MQYLRRDQRLQLTKINNRAEQMLDIPVFRDMPYVQSSALEQVSYDERRHTLCATFRETGRTYIYEEVPQELYDSLLFADSLGAFFNTHIRGHFAYREI